MSNTIPEIPSGSLFGHLKNYVADPLHFLQSHQKKYGDIFTFRVATRQLIFINQPDYIRRVLQDNNRNYQKSEAYRRLAMLLGDGLFTSEGDYWRTQRRTIQPAFHRDQIKSYAHIMHDYSCRMLERWQQQKEIELATEMTGVTLQIINKTMLNVEMDQGGHVVAEHLPFALRFMINRITSPVNVPLWIPTGTNVKFKNALKILDQLIHEIIQYKKNHLDIDLLSQLITLKDQDTWQGMTDRQLRDEVMTLFLAGHETTAMALTWTLNFLMRSPEVMSRIQKELKSIKNPWDGLHNIYLQHVIHEALRMFAPVWILSREACGDDRLGPYAIHKGDRIIFSPYIVHRNPDYWELPDQFNPSRFDQAPKHRYAFFPFGGGPRVCIGQHFALMEMTILLVNILQNFPKIHLKSMEPVGYDYSLTLRPDRRILACLTD